MGRGKHFSDFLSNGAKTIASIGKILILSKFHTYIPKVSFEQDIVILGNGPSLNDTVETSSAFLQNKKLLAVNFAANTDLFFDLKPEYYVLADPHFFKGIEHENVKKLWDNLNHSDWKLNLFIPANIPFKEIPLNNNNITLIRYNLTPIEGYRCIQNFAFSTGLGMPRPRNVLIPSLMIALRMGFKNIYVAGADHSWTKTLSVDDENRVVSIQPHFYKEHESEKQRVATEYMNYPLHTIMYSFYVAFKSYFIIERYAKRVGANIWNITPNSFIDAFPRKKL